MSTKPRHKENLSNKNCGLTQEVWKQAMKQYGPWIHRRARRMAFQLPTHVATNLYEDLVGAGFRGFVEAIQRLDPNRPETTEAFVKQTISGAMLDELRRLDPLSRDQRRRQRALRDVERALTGKLGRLPTADEMACGARMTLEELHKTAAQSTPTLLSLDAPLCSDGDALVNMLPNEQSENPHEEALVREQQRMVFDAMERLPETHQMVVRRYYLEANTLESIGNRLNVCAARASQIRKEAVDRIRRDISERLAS
jgi:RNA polymerase sigma factor for flagellar operon FliA